MALETITGFITTYARTATTLPGLRLFFVPTGNAVQGDHLFVTQRVQATISNASTGAFTVNLEASDTLYGVPDGSLRYYPRIEWLDSANNSIGMDFVQWQMRVPVGGGTLEDILDAPTNSDALYFSAAPTYADLLVDVGNLSPGTDVYWTAAPEGEINYFEAA
ncbi:hypothetical protein B7R22_05285 [Subtercola boreus]|uniref:Uncharacterized protein n=1 Tax=Subtercola boreus TaxID=120213 RepID=A0A3E0W1E4_9MICO|nr:hypothetical protein [Subtercola boreus]RFA15821.1 hypothetical protein B7R22_05285 [Subtercola boreus]